ncbi:hypothetical protein F7725_002328 [Dissostichus mawsoni]|uniref:VWFA domain-containing protein n=1 Tax=Dissostichus mawsoni TaxID=36200 RepID=A0A7J5Y3W9_DISMA|nr:hypothetical protein F7725_002328 [Dissostichus mawsoni]
MGPVGFMLSVTLSEVHLPRMWVEKHPDKDSQITKTLSSQHGRSLKLNRQQKHLSSTELWRPLRALSLLPPSRGVRNLLLLSDGHIQNAELTLQLLRDNAEHSRLFTCGLSPTANRHMLRALAQAGRSL